MTADSAQAVESPASYAVDGNPATIWHTQYAPTTPGLPHTFIIDMHATNIVTGLRYLPRNDGKLNGNIGAYQIHVSSNGTSWGNPVSSGTFGDDTLEKTIPFAATQARFIRLTALTEAGNRGPWSSAAEINVTGNSTPTLPRNGWTAAADSAQAGTVEGPAANVLDGNNGTIWHTQYSPTVAPLPHWITIDMHATNIVSGLRYQPRTDHVNGDIGGYQIHVSTDGSTWGNPVASGTFGDGAAEKIVPFAPIAARYVRLTALTEAGNRGPWSNAAEINLNGNPVPVLNRAAWTIAADSAQANESPAIQAIDGSVTSIWHTQYMPTTPGLPHTLTIDMHSSNIVTGLRYLPRQNGQLNGNIGSFQIHTSTDGNNWGSPVASGTWADNAAEKTVAFTPVTTRFVRLTALTEAGNRGPWSSAAEINLTGGEPLPAANVGGSWGPTIGFPIVPVGAAQLPNGNLLTWAATYPYNYAGGTGQTQTAILNLSNGTVGKRIVTETGHDMFCPGTVRLPDGRLMITGGSDAPNTSFYNPANDTWTAGPPMTIGRGYQSDVALSNGNVFTIGGSWNGGQGGKNGEVWSPATGWRALPGVPVTPILTQDPMGVYRADNHTWLFAISDQRVLQAGPSKQMNIIDTKGNGSITSAGNRADDTDAMNGSAVMYDINKILTIGGSQAYNGPTTTSNRAYVIDISNGVAARRTGNMNYPRAFTHAVVLPDGKVLAVTGTSEAQPELFSDTAAVLTPEIWDPATEQFTKLAPMAVPRTYHSTAMLLPDGRIFVGGGGLCGNCPVNHPDAQIFSPPYLFKADGTPATRPAITTAPGTAALGANVTVTTDRAVNAFSLVRMGSVTHSVNTDQRRIPLTASAVNGTSYTLPIPSDPGVVTPGFYMLFAMDANGVPSIAKPVQVG